MTIDDAKSDPPILDYALPSRGLPDNESAAEQALARGESIRTVSAYFHSPSAAAVSLRWAIARVFNSNALPGPCSCCDGAGTSIVLLHWQFVVPMQRFAVYVAQSNVTAWTLTAHACCEPCKRVLVQRSRIALWGQRSLQVMIGLLAFEIVLAVRSGGPNSDPSVSLVLTLIGLFATALVAHRGLPIIWTWHIRSMLRRPTPHWLQFRRGEVQG